MKIFKKIFLNLELDTKENLKQIFQQQSRLIKEHVNNINPCVNIKLIPRFKSEKQYIYIYMLKTPLY